jgi:hypothetical protein
LNGITGPDDPGRDRRLTWASLVEEGVRHGGAGVSGLRRPHALLLELPDHDGEFDGIDTPVAID